MAANYTLPVFNIQCAIWRFGNPTANPPDVISSCNLALGRRTGHLPSLAAQGGDGQGAMWLLLPPGTDVQDLKNGVGPDTVEVPSGSGRFYQASWVDDIGSGFLNEHRFAELTGVPAWPLPFPRGGVVLGIAGGATFLTAVPIPFGLPVILQAPAGSTSYYSLPSCCAELYSLRMANMAGAGTAATYTDPSAAPVLDVAPIGNGSSNSTFPPPAKKVIYLEIIADPVIPSAPTVEVGKQGSNVTGGGLACGTAVQTTFPLRGTVFVPNGFARYIQFPLGSGVGYRVDMFTDDPLGQWNTTGSPACAGGGELAGIGISTGTLAPGIHVGPDCVLTLLCPGPDCNFTFQIF